MNELYLNRWRVFSGITLRTPLQVSFSDWIRLLIGDESGNREVGGRPQSDETSATDPTVGIGSSAPASIEHGTVIGDYLIQETIGVGGGGSVYKARHQRMGRTVAIKFLNHLRTSNRTGRLRFQREVQAAGKLMHPNIVTAFDAGEFQDTLYLVMEYIDGESLADHIRDKGTIPLRAASLCIIEAAKALEYAHSQGVVHRDIKPGNIMLDRIGQVKLLDMGLARLTEPAPEDGSVIAGELTEHGYVIGTVGYMSPEQVRNTHDVDGRTDIYSLGCTFHFLLTGRPPFTGSATETLIAHAQAPVPSLHDTQEDLPPFVDEVFQRMLAKEPHDRYGAMGELIGDLERLVGVKSSAGAALGAVARRRPNRKAAGTSGVRDSSMVTKAVGFDVGTNSATVSTIGDDGLPIAAALEEGRNDVPAVVSFKDGVFEVGGAASELLRSGGSLEHVAERFVCRLGAADSMWTLDGRAFPAQLLTATLISRLAERAKRRVGYFSHLAYTVPGCFGERQRHAYHDAYRIASQKTLEPISASTAVAAHFGFMQGWLNPQTVPVAKHILVFRFGAGSFDASVIRFAEGCFSTLAVNGDAELGGGIWDERIAETLAEQVLRKYGVNLAADPTQFYRLRQGCESAKVLLTKRESTPIKFQLSDKTVDVILKRDLLDLIGCGLLNRAKQLTSRVLASAGVEAQKLDHVLLAGGASRMPQVRSMVEQFVGNPRICFETSGEAAAHGAALYAQSQIDAEHPQAFDVEEIASSFFGVLGVNRVTQEKQTTVVIPKNSVLPISVKSAFSTSVDNQTSIALDIVEGQDPSLPNPRPVGRCNITSLPAGLPKGSKILIEFHVARDGTLSVTVENAATGRQTRPEIDRASGMSQAETIRWRDWLDTGLMCGQFD